MPQLIKDPYFRVEIDLQASSPEPESAIWHAQHTTVCEGFSLDDNPPEDPGGAIIRHQLKPRHYSVLDFAFVKLDFGGFPHSTVMQLVRHQGKTTPLVQSGRYTGKRFLDIAHSPDPWLSIDKVFYFRPVGDYADRQGHKYSYTVANLDTDRDACIDACCRYARRIERESWSEEHARDFIPQNFRQNFTLACTIRSAFHWLHQRTLADSQLEAQTLAWMALDRLRDWSPTLFGYFSDHLAGKNTLAP